MATQAAKRLPLTVIGGFLGAGKTTLLNHWLRRAGSLASGGSGQRLAVLVNDFGSLNIDAALVQSAGADTIALSNGCVCCAVGDDLSAALIMLLDAEPGFDAVVVEASGVADPWRIAQVALADPAFSLGGVVVLVDAAHFLAQHADPLLADSLRRQLHGADLLVLNKTDLGDADTLLALRQWLDEQLPATPRIETHDAQVPALLLDELRLNSAPSLPLASACDGQDHAAHHSHAPAHHGQQFDSVSWQPAGVLSAISLRQLLQHMPTGVLRLKGLLRTDSHDWAELQFAGRHGGLRKALQAPADGTPAVVAIGLAGQLPRKALDAVFGAALAK